MMIVICLWCRPLDRWKKTVGISVGWWFCIFEFVYISFAPYL